MRSSQTGDALFTVVMHLTADGAADVQAMLDLLHEDVDGNVKDVPDGNI
jgi:hypothetical protein